MTTVIDDGVEILDDMLNVLAHCPAKECRLVAEHANSARISLLGAMRVEFEVNLEMTKTASSRIPDPKTRARVKVLLNELASVRQAL